MTTEGAGSDDGQRAGAIGTPAPRPDVAHALVRTRLLTRLDRIEAAGVIRSLPGYGRSVLARQWADRQRDLGHPVAWTCGPWDEAPGGA